MNEALIVRVFQEHFPNKPATMEEIQTFETHYKVALPADMRLFYLRCDGASLFAPEREGPPFRLMRVSELCRARVAVYGVDSLNYGPDHHFVFCDRGDGDFVAIDLSEPRNQFCPIIDCWHEAYPDKRYCRTIGSSFEWFLERALESGGNSMFWMD